MTTEKKVVYDDEGIPHLEEETEAADTSAEVKTESETETETETAAPVDMPWNEERLALSDDQDEEIFYLCIDKDGSRYAFDDEKAGETAVAIGELLRRHGGLKKLLATAVDYANA